MGCMTNFKWHKQKHEELFVKELFDISNIIFSKQISSILLSLLQDETFILKHVRDFFFFFYILL